MTTSISQRRKPGNPFGVSDVPNPDDGEVLAFAASNALHGDFVDENAAHWTVLDVEASVHSIEGKWFSRWNGGADPTIPDDAPHVWKQGTGEVRVSNQRVYMLFDWDQGRRQGLIDARREGASRLVGKYMNLRNPEIIMPWIGSIVSPCRIDGRWTSGRLDFRR